MNLIKIHKQINKEANMDKLIEAVASSLLKQQQLLNNQSTLIISMAETLVRIESIVKRLETNTANLEIKTNVSEPS